MLKRQLFTVLVLTVALLLTWALPSPAQAQNPAEKLPFPEDLAKRILLHTSFFEGHFSDEQNYSTTAGNWDGCGMSFGILQFNFCGSDSLTYLMRDYIKIYPQEFRQIFGNKADEVRRIIMSPNRRARLKWGDRISQPPQKNKLKPEWQKKFERLGTSPNMRKIQLVHAAKWMEQARLMAERYNIETTQGVGFVFDQATQSWEFKSPKDLEKKMKTARNDRARLQKALEHVRPEVAKRRRVLIHKGKGEYFKRPYDISQYKLDYQKKWKP